jgi:hypothetical protein
LGVTHSNCNGGEETVAFFSDDGSIFCALHPWCILIVAKCKQQATIRLVAQMGLPNASGWTVWTHINGRTGTCGYLDNQMDSVILS